MTRIRTLALLLTAALLGTFLFAGCAQDVAEEPAPPPVAEPTQPEPGEPPAEPGEPPAEPEASAFPWLDVELEDVQTGERFRLADFAGRPVLLKSFAVW